MVLHNINFSDTPSLKLLETKGSIGHAFTVCIHTENQNQASFYPFVLREISVLTELALGHLVIMKIPDQLQCASTATTNAAFWNGPAQSKCILSHGSRTGRKLGFPELQQSMNLT